MTGKSLIIFLYLYPQVYSEYSWVAEADLNGPIHMDIFFDRAVFMGYGDMPLSIGVFITLRHVLTSYNPYREARKMGGKSIKITYLVSRNINSTWYITHNTAYVMSKCARQIVPVIEDELTEKQWHGIKKKHSPVHDLFVIRIANDLAFIDPDPRLYWFKYNQHAVSGPLVTRVAATDDILGRTVKFAANDMHLGPKTISSREFEEDDNVVVDCEEWMLRDWGRFICLRNPDNYPKLASGALLIYQDTLFGIGSFYLRKGNHSLLVFTDVRPYYKSLFYTCRYVEDKSFNTTKYIVPEFWKNK